MIAAAFVVSLLAVSALATTTPQQTPLPVALNLNADPVGCALCEFVFGKLEQWIASEKTEAEIEQLLDNLCKILPSGGEAVCDKLISVTVHELIEIMKTFEDPKDLCRQMGACDGPTPPVPEECSICQYVLHDIEVWVDSNKTVTEIEHFIDTICTIMPSDWQPACKQIADEGVEKLIALLLKYEDPQIVCEQIGLCTATSSEIHPDDFGCDACILVATELENWIALNFTESKIESLLDLICSILPSGATQVCDKIMEIGVKELIKIMKEVENPAELCRQLGACTGPVPEPAECHICKIILKDIENWIADGKTVKEIEQLVEQICNIFTSEKYKQVCDKIADVTVERIIQYLLDTESPEIVCQQIDLC